MKLLRKLIGHPDTHVAHQRLAQLQEENLSASIMHPRAASVSGYPQGGAVFEDDVVHVVTCIQQQQHPPPSCPIMGPRVNRAHLRDMVTAVTDRLHACSC